MDIVLYIILALLTTTTALYIFGDKSKSKLPGIPLPLAFVLAIVVIYKLSTYPITLYSDKMVFLNDFNNITWSKISTAKDKGWAVYVYLIKLIFNNSFIFFLITASVYVSGYVLFARKFLNKSYIFIFLLISFMSFGFAAYGVNTIRAGVALSLLLIAISFHKSKVLFLLFGILAVLFHKSMLLPFCGLIITYYFSNLRYFLCFWVLCLIISAINFSPITEFVKNILMDNDERLAGYFSETNARRYNTGFRVDFVLYSSVSIIIGLYYLIKLKLEDKVYLQFFNTYLLVNSIWLLAIQMAFTDRVAYLSWFMMPFLLMYPLLKYDLPIDQRKWVTIILIGNLCFNSYMYFS